MLQVPLTHGSLLSPANNVTPSAGRWSLRNYLTIRSQKTHGCCLVSFLLVGFWWPSGGLLVALWWPSGGLLVASWWSPGGLLVRGGPGVATY